MTDYILTGCSSADLSKAKFEAIGVPYAHLHYELGGKKYLDDLWQSMNPKDFYQAMLDGAESRTSQININEYSDFWRPFLEQGKNIIHLTLSSGLSGTVNSARIASEELLREFPNRRIAVIDSLAASSGFGLLLDTLAGLRDQGMSFDELVSWAEGHKHYLHHWFFSSDLTFFIRGGRVSKTAGFFGKLLNICPMLNVNDEGRLIPREKIRSRKKAIKVIVEHMEEHAENGLDYSGKCFISHSDRLEDAQAVAALVEETFPKLNGKVEIYDIGSTIGAHTGPGTIALFFWSKDRRVR